MKKVWKDKYSQPLNFPTRKMAATSFAEAIQIFGKGSVRLIERMDGSVDVVVGKPLDIINKENQRLENTNTNNNNEKSNYSGDEGTSSRQQQTGDGGLLADARNRIQRRSRNGREAQKQGILSQEDRERRNQEDRDTLEKLAKEQRKWVNNVDAELEKKYGKRIGQGSEAWVYLKDKNTVIKSRSLTGYETIQGALRSIELHNTLFPETAMKVIGFGESEGEFTVLLGSF